MGKKTSKRNRAKFDLEIALIVPVPWCTNSGVIVGKLPNIVQTQVRNLRQRHDPQISC